MLGFVVGLAAEARLLRRVPAPVFVGGGGVAGAQMAVQAALAAGVTELVSFGLAGGLDPACAPGRLVVPARVLWRGQVYAADGGLLARLGGATAALLLAGEAVVVTAAQKRAVFAETTAVAVDLESGPVVESGVGFAVVRAVVDPATQDLPPAALAALDQAGVIGLGRVLAALARGPGQLGALLALAGQAAQARATLRDFVAARWA